MIKSFIFVVLAGLATHAAPASTVHDEPNFKACAASDPSWMSRWGQWIVGSDLYKTSDDCRRAAWPSTNVSARQAGCYINGKFYRAGYYCYKP